MNRNSNSLPQVLRSTVYFDPLWVKWCYALLVFWLLTMISIPFLRWVLGDAVLRWGFTVPVALLTSAVLAFVHRTWGTGPTLRAVAWILPLTWAIEWIGSRTGLPFGVYHYTGYLQPQLGHVPLVIPLAWLMMLPPAWAVAGRITGQTAGAGFIAVSALAFTAWDLFLDPQMVAWGFWAWEQPGGYFGIPWLNFAGWALAAAALTAWVQPRPLTDPAFLLIYITSWLLQSIGQLIFWGQPGPALAGFVGMGVFVMAAWRKGKYPGSSE